MQETRQLKRKLYIALLAIAITVFATVTATFAWYIYNTSQHTTNVHMAAGTGATIQIANRYDGTYGQSAVLDAFVGSLNPVSTNSIQGGFQKVYGFSDGSEDQPSLVASIFGESDSSDFYKTSLFLRTSGKDTQVYLSDIGYEDDDADNPISTAIRVGIVVHQVGKNMPEDKEYIFEINTERNLKGEYNTQKGKNGEVLDCTKTDGSTVKFTPYNNSNYCNYDNETGEVTLKKDSLPVGEITGADNGAYGEPVQVDVYIWLEGCDRDCTNNISSKTLRNLAISFAGYEK